MAGERTFIVKILGNADGAITAFKKLGREASDAVGGLDGIKDKLSKGFGLVKDVAFAAAGAVTALAGASVLAAKAAAEDQRSQELLAKQLQNSTGATELQIAAVEDFIEKAMMATGIADDQLRPAFGNLARATGNTAESQKLFNLALDISAATGRDLESVTIALGRAANGQVTALQRLGIPLDENVKKSKDFNQAVGFLTDQFGGSAKAAADTFQGRLKILQTSFGELIESIGYYLLPLFEKIVKSLQERLIPALKLAIDNFGEKGLKGSLVIFMAALGPFGLKVIDTFESIAQATITLGGKFKWFAGVAAAALAIPTGPKNALDAYRTIVNGIGDASENTAAKFDSLRAQIAISTIQINALNGPLRTSADTLDRILPQSGIAAKKSFEDLVPEIQKTGGSLDKTTEAAKRQKEAADELAKVLNEQMNQALKAAQKQLDDVRDKFDDLAKTTTRGILGALDFGKALEVSDDSGDSFIDVLEKQAKAGTDFADVIKKLVAAGLAEPALRQVLDAGITAGTKIGNELLKSTDNIIKANQLISTLEQVAKTIGDSAANAFYGAGVKDGEAYLKGVEAAIAAAQARLAGAKKPADVKGAAATFADIASRVTPPTVPTPTPTATTPSTVVNITTGIGTDGREAARQIVEILNNYSYIDPNFQNQFIGSNIAL